MSGAYAMNAGSSDAAPRQTWSSNLLFLIAAIGAEAGVASVWKFTYLAGTNGGGLFVFSYAMALAIIAVPALLAEMLIGRRGGGSMIGSLRALVDIDAMAKPWIGLGYLGLITLVLTISYYYIVCGWMLDYLQSALLGRFDGMDGRGAQALFAEVMASPGRMLINSGILIAISGGIVATGVNNGIERVSLVLTPLRFAVLLLLVVFAAITADAGAAAQFLFALDPARFTLQSVISAVGQAFFSLGIGMGVMMTVASYMKTDYSLAKAVVVVGSGQILVGLLAGMTIFPVVFSAGIPPAEGPGLLFVALPLALAHMPGGYFAGVALFLTMTFAAITATSVMLEAISAALKDVVPLSKKALVWLGSLVIWAMGAVTALSFNEWSTVHPLSWFGITSTKSPFELLDYATSNILMPLGGVLVAVLAGWGLRAALVADEVHWPLDGAKLAIFRFLLRWLIPAVVIALFFLML
jgi:NSS family neurotransmitter:Na+ symporter